MLDEYVYPFALTVCLTYLYVAVSVFTWPTSITQVFNVLLEELLLFTTNRGTDQSVTQRIQVRPYYYLLFRW